MSYIPLIKTVKWVDLSDEHKKLRETLENDLKSACSGDGNVQPIMLQGAFGIGKSTTLYYLFHYGWEILKTPTFYLPLSRIVDSVKEEAIKKESGKIENNQLSSIISAMINAQIDTLVNLAWDEIYELDFPEFKGKNDDNKLSLTEYLKDFKSVVLDSNDETASNAFENLVFSESIIEEAIASNRTPLILVDEFESKFYELKRFMESSGGGVLRELFDQIVQTKPFMLVIGNGPASGYEVAKEKGVPGNNDSETAANRRLKKLPIPFPTVDLLKRKFMNDKPNGFVNFIWWMSRCRPGHIQKLMDEIDYSIFKHYNSSDFISHSVFNQPIDESGEEVKYLKIGFFDTINSYIFPVVKDLLVEFQPQEILLEDTYKDALKDSENAYNFYCSDELVSIEKNLLPAMKDDIYQYLEKCKSEGKYTNVDYIRNLNKYFNYILSACSNNKGEIAFNTTSKDEEYALAYTFLIPILELVYDFISQYEDGDDNVVKETKDFILDCTKFIERSEKNGQIAEDFPTLNDLFSGFKIIKVKSGSDVYLQFSLRAVREFIEQPIGSPRLKYKNMSLETKLSSVNIRQSVLLCNDDNNQRVVFVPVLEENQFDRYILRLKDYIKIQKTTLHENGQKTLLIIYFQENDQIKNLESEVTTINDELIPIAKYSKIAFECYEDYQFNFGGQIADFIDSIAKIAIAGCSCGEIQSASEDNTISIRSVIESIKNREWTKQKEVVRTIEHYEKLVCEGENSVLKRIEESALNDYNEALENALCERDDYKDSIQCDFTTLCDTSVTDEMSKYIGLYYILEKCFGDKKICESLTRILNMVGNHSNSLYLEPKPETITKALYFDQIIKVISSTSSQGIMDKFDANDKFLTRLETFAENMKTEKTGKNISDILSFMQDELKEHWMTSYNEKMSYYDFSKGEIYVKLIYLKKYIDAIDFSDIRVQLSNRINEKEKELIEARGKISTSIQAITDLLYSPDYAKKHPESMPFPGYIKELQGVCKLLTECKRVLDEERTSISALCIVWSIVWRIANIATSASSLSRQISGIQVFLNQKKEIVERNYQTPINTIYSDVITAKLISLGDSKVQGQTPKYDGNYCWNQLTRYHLTTKPEAQSIFDTKLLPALENNLKQEDIQKFNDYLQNIIVSTDSGYKRKMDEVLENCKKCQSEAQKYTTLYGYITELLKFEEQ